MTTGPDLAEQLATRRGWQLLLFPLGRTSQGPAAEQMARRDRLVDAGFIAGSVLFGAFFLASSWAQHDTAAAVLDIALGVASCAALLDRRRHPASVAAFTVAASAVSASASGAAIVALFSAAIRLRGRTVGLLALAEVIATAVFPLLYSDGHTFSYGQQIVVGALINLVAVGWGLLVGVQRRYLEAVLRHADLVRVEQQLLTTAARDAERRRMAREIHDVLAHRLSLLSVHAGALEFRTDLPVETTQAMAGVIRQSSHDALQELHSAIGALRDGTDRSASLHPQPGLAELSALIDQSRTAGTRVILELDVDDLHGGEHNEASERTAYRIVQECLTNARKHAPDSPVRITIESAGSDRLGVAVRTRLPADAQPPGPPIPGSGTGLLGLTERVALAGGELHHGPSQDEFVVRATLPWSP